MSEVKTVGVKELKNKLSAYLREVRAGARILISDRDTVVAELHEPIWERSSVIAGSRPLSDWIRAGTVHIPSAEKQAVPQSPVRVEDGLSRRLLDEGRGDTRT